MACDEKGRAARARGGGRGAAGRPCGGGGGLWCPHGAWGGWPSHPSMALQLAFYRQPPSRFPSSMPTHPPTHPPHTTTAPTPSQPAVAMSSEVTSILTTYENRAKALLVRLGQLAQHLRQVLADPLHAHPGKYMKPTPPTQPTHTTKGAATPPAFSPSPPPPPTPPLNRLADHHHPLPRNRDAARAAPSGRPTFPPILRLTPRQPPHHPPTCPCRHPLNALHTVVLGHGRGGRTVAGWVLGERKG